VLDRGRRILRVFDGVKPEGHAAELLAALGELSGKRKLFEDADVAQQSVASRKRKVVKAKPAAAAAKKLAARVGNRTSKGARAKKASTKKTAAKRTATKKSADVRKVTKKIRNRKEV
jgi:hypothetical protein